MNIEKSLNTRLSIFGGFVSVAGAFSVVFTQANIALFNEAINLMINPQYIIAIVIWIIFSNLYLICLLYEKNHPQEHGEGNIIARNYPLTLWVWGTTTIILYFSSKLLEVQNNLLGLQYFYISKVVNIPSILISTIGIVVMILGLVLVTLGRVRINGYWRTHIYRFEKNKLQTEGIYKIMRHPIYSGQIYMSLGTALAMDSFLIAIFLFLPVFYINKLRAKREEIELAKLLDYENYTRNVPIAMLFPFI